MTQPVSVGRVEVGPTNPETGSQLEWQPQRGIKFPRQRMQPYVLLVRLNLASDDRPSVQQGLQALGAFLNDTQVAAGSDVHFSATVGFGSGFFDKLQISQPPGLKAMPAPDELGDRLMPGWQLPGGHQADMIIQLCSAATDFNQAVLGNASDTSPVADDSTRHKAIQSIVAGWAHIVDTHAGFVRANGRNMLGFHDGLSNPYDRSPAFDTAVWMSKGLLPGTFMVFDKIALDLDGWQALRWQTQEAWIGRSKATGLLRGTLSPTEDTRVGELLRQLEDKLAGQQPVNLGVLRGAWSSDQETTLKTYLASMSANPGADWDLLKRYNTSMLQQRNPMTSLFDHRDGQPTGKPSHGDIAERCPVWTHVRKANPRHEDGNDNLQTTLIFRRGYNYAEPGSTEDELWQSGLLFIAFQRDVNAGFERIKKDQLNKASFPVPDGRAGLTSAERRALVKLLASEKGIQRGDEPEEIGPELMTRPVRDGQIIDPQVIASSREPDADMPRPIALGMGGGYYFIPHLPNGDMTQVGQAFFKSVAAV